MLDVLARWNRWGGSRLPSGLPRDITDTLQPFLTSPDIVVLIGPRRAGKSTVMWQIMDHLEKAGIAPESMLHVNLEEPALSPDLDTGLLDRLYETFREEVAPGGRAFLFLDEIQRVPGWERWVRARSETENVKIFVTGSSSALMSRELGTLLTGRHVSFHVHPLSFSEFLRFKAIPLPARTAVVGSPPKMQHALNDYLRWGGFPEVVLAKEVSRKEILLKQYFDDVLYKDVAMRHQIRDVTTLRSLAVHLLTQTASLISFQRLARIFGVSLDQVRAYCGYLQEAFLIDLLPYYSLKVSERNRNPQKVHAIDSGLRNIVCLTGSPDRGRLAESVVFQSLDRVKHDGLYYWKGTGEIDFAVRLGNRIEALVQVVYDLRENADVAKREIASFVAATERFPQARKLLVVGRGRLPARDVLPRSVQAIFLWQFLATEPAIGRLARGRRRQGDHETGHGGSPGGEERNG